MSKLLLLTVVVAMSGCCSTSQYQSQIYALQSENAKLRNEVGTTQAQTLQMQRDAIAQQRKNECILRHNDAKQSCDMLYRGEPNSILLQNKLRQCLSNKGFPRGLDSCGL